ncbi:MAG: glycosyltransferase [Acutalibacteraceae bacterium]|nr:glycosyltransferase [Acutalibacteraceae bacterium]
MNENMPLISIIVPVYNVEKYLERCVGSIISQTYENLEIILVNDGSPDKSGEICDTFAKIDSRIEVYHKENGGLSDARNFGVEHSSGEYVAFIDSDDYIAPNYIEYLLSLIKKYNADISACYMTETYGDTADYRTNDEFQNEQLLTGKEACLKLFGNLYSVLVTAWGKLYRSDIVKKYIFPVGKIHEDEATTCKYYYEATRVAVGNRCLYAYYQNPKGIMHTKGNSINPDVIWSFEHRAEFFEEHNERKLAGISWNFLYNYLVRDSIENQGRSDNLIKSFAKGKRVGLKTRLEVILYSISPYFYRKLLDIKNSLEKVAVKKGLL